MRIEKPGGENPGDKGDEPKRHKLSPIATGVHEVVEFKTDTVLIRREDEL